MMKDDYFFHGVFLFFVGGGGGVHIFVICQTGKMRSTYVSTVIHHCLTPLKSYRLLFVLTAVKYGYRGSTVVKVQCYKSEGGWFDPSCCHWNFSLT